MLPWVLMLASAVQQRQQQKKAEEQAQRGMKVDLHNRRAAGLMGYDAPPDYMSYQQGDQPNNIGMVLSMLNSQGSNSQSKRAPDLVSPEHLSAGKNAYRNQFEDEDLGSSWM